MLDALQADATAGLQRIWRASILPLLEEYHYGDLTPDQVRERYRLDGFLAALPAPD